MNKKLLQTSLTTWLITAIVLATGVGDVLGAFIRTNLAGTPDWSCGYWYGYDTSFWYSNGYWADCGTNSPASGWSRYQDIPLPTPHDNDKSDKKSSTGDDKPSKSGSGSNNTPDSNDNPYGSTKTNWDDGIAQWTTATKPTESSSTNNWVSNTKSNSVVELPKRRLPATGV